MFKKLSIKTLTWVFIGLFILTLAFKISDHTNGINTLKAELFNIDETSITSIIVKPKILNGQSIELKKDKDNWRVLYEGNSYTANVSVIDQLVEELNGLKPLRLASQSKDKWKHYELTDSLATEVQFMGNKEELAKLYIGKFSYSQPKTNGMMQQNPYMQAQGTMTTYVRYNDEKEVYAVEGFLSNTTNRKVDTFRDKTLLKVNKNEINKIAFSYPADSSFTMIKKEEVWLCNGIQLDSSSVAKYLNSITSLKGTSFTDAKNTSFPYRAKIYNNNNEPIEISAAIENDQVFFTTSQNTKTYFKEEQKTNFNKLFISKEKLIN